MFNIYILLLLIIPALTSNVTSAQFGFVLGKYDLYVVKQSINNHRQQSLVLYNNAKEHTLIPLNLTKKFTSGASDVNNNTVYLAGEEGLISFLNVYTGESGVAYQDIKAKLTDLQFFNNTLFWIANKKEIVSFDLSQQHKSVLVKISNDDLLMGLTVDRRDGSLYYSIWTRSSPQGTPTINHLKNQTSKIIASDQELPRALYHHVSQLYYVSSPPGHHFLIQSIDDSTGDQSLILKQRHKYCSSLAVTCKGDVYWSDVVNKMVWRVNNTSNEVSQSLEELGRGAVALFGRGCSWEEMMEMEAREEREEVEAMRIVQENVDVRNGGENVQTTKVPVLQTTTEETVESTIRLCSSQEAINCADICVVYNRSPTCLSKNQPSTEPSLLSEEKEVPYDWPPYIIALVSVLSTVASIMTLVSVYMTVRVRSLSRKPIIRRRVVVSRSTSESQSSTNPTSVCEMIDIENCCNMNVCETPCYERTLLQPAPSSSTPGSTVISVNSSNSSWGPCNTKKDDKRCLLTR